MSKYTSFMDANVLYLLTGKHYRVDQNASIVEITPVDASDTDAQSVLDTLVAKMGLYKLADEHEEKALEEFMDGTAISDAITRRG
tara:strand:- start:901 stop:1155 length:255 start_codon:yes stop_codon:yes gene_type:complete